MSKENTKSLQNMITDFFRSYKGEDSALILTAILAVELNAQRKQVSLAGKWHTFAEYIATAQSELPELTKALTTKTEFLRGGGLWEKDIAHCILQIQSVDLLTLESAEIGWAILDVIYQESLNNPNYFLHQRTVAELAVEWIKVEKSAPAYCPSVSSLSFAYAFSVKGASSVFTAGATKALALATLLSLFVEGQIETQRVLEIQGQLDDYNTDITFTQGVASPVWGVNVALEKLVDLPLDYQLTYSESLFTQYMVNKVTGRCVVIVPPSMLHRTTSEERGFKENLVKSGKLAAVVQLSPGASSISLGIAPVMLFIDSSQPQQTLMVDASHAAFYQKKGRINYFVGKNPVLSAIANADPKFTQRLTIEAAQANDWNLDVSRYVLSDEAQQLQAKLKALSTIPLHEVVDFVRCQAIKGEEAGELFFEANQSDINVTGLFNQPQKAIKIADPKTMTRITRQRMLPGDVLMTVKGNIGKVGLVSDNAAENWIAGQSFIILRLKPNAAIQDMRYLLRYLNSPLAQHALQSKAAGATIKSIKMKDLEELPIAVPTPLQIKEALQKHQRAVSLQAEIAQLQQEMADLQQDNWLTV